MQVLYGDPEVWKFYFINFIPLFHCLWINDSIESINHQHANMGVCGAWSFPILLLHNPDEKKCYSLVTILSVGSTHDPDWNIELLILAAETDQSFSSDWSLLIIISVCHPNTTVLPRTVAIFGSQDSCWPLSQRIWKGMHAYVHFTWTPSLSKSFFLTISNYS